MKIEKIINGYLYEKYLLMIFFVYLHKKWYEHILETTNGFEEIPSVWESDCSESMIRESRFGEQTLLHR